MMVYRIYLLEKLTNVSVMMELQNVTEDFNDETISISLFLRGHCAMGAMD